jgi:hypothetical protein
MVNPTQKQQNALDRIALLEKASLLVGMAMSDLSQRVNHSHMMLMSGMEDIAEQIAALKDVLSADDQGRFDESLKRIQTESDAKVVADRRQRLQQAVDAGYVRSIQTSLDETDTYVGIERLPDGSVARPGVVFFDRGTASPELVPHLIGSEVGDKVSIESGRTMEILEIYEVIDEKQPEQPAAR